MGTTTATITFEEFERMPEQPGKQELLRGELIELPPADLNHSKIAHLVFRKLDAALRDAQSCRQSTELGEAFLEAGYKLADGSYVQPDVSICHASQPSGKYFEGAPAIAIEVVSPGNSAEALVNKTELYFEYGALEVWLVYPKRRRVIVWVNGNARAIAADQAVTTPLLPGFALKVNDILPTV